MTNRHGWRRVGRRRTGATGVWRICREALSFRVYGSEIVPSKSAVDFARDVVAQELRACFHETLGEAYEKEKQESAWLNQVRVLLLAADRSTRSYAEPLST